MHFWLFWLPLPWASQCCVVGGVQTGKLIETLRLWKQCSPIMAWQVPWVPFWQWFWSSCVAFSVGLSPTPGLGHTVTTSSLWEVVAALFLKVAACVRGHTLFHTYSVSFPRYLNVLCAYWITEPSVSGSLNISRTALRTRWAEVPKCSFGDCWL